METFESLRDYRIVRINENKDRFIQKNTLLTDEQKAEVLDFFRSHANLEAKVNNGNWNYNIPYEEFKKVMTSVDTEEKRLKKQTKELRKQTGLEGLTEGGDYAIVEDTLEYIAYTPKTHKAMRVIASNMVEPKLWCESSVMTWSPKEILPKGEPMKGDLYPGAKWCVAMETYQHWKRYINTGRRFVVVCSKNPEMREEFKKICLVYGKSWELSIRESRTASDVSLKDIQSDYIETVIKNLDTILHPETKENPLEKIQGCYNSKSKVYKLSKKVISPRDLLRIGKLDHPVVWTGNFILKGAVESLEGCPNKVTGDFSCSSQTSLMSLEGAPEYVGGDFDCTWCSSLTSLKGAPKYVGGGFSCKFCENLISLEGCPESVRRDFSCGYCPNLTSLKGAPEKVEGYFECSDCNKLTSLKGAPKHVKEFGCSRCRNLLSLEGAPEEVEGTFGCEKCDSLTSLKGAPKRVGGSFYCEDCKSLTSLKGAPEYVGKNFYCKFCDSLTSLEGAPKFVGGDFACYDCGKPFYKDVETLDTEAANFVV